MAGCLKTLDIKCSLKKKKYIPMLIGITYLVEEYLSSDCIRSDYIQKGLEDIHHSHCPVEVSKWRNNKNFNKMALAYQN